MKIALLILWDFYKSPFSDEIELGSLTEMLRQKGFDVKLFSRYPDENNYAEIIDYNPDLFGCIIYQHSKRTIIECTKFLKDKNPNIINCVISSETQSAIDIIKEYSWVDFAIDGESEDSFLDLALYLKNKDKSIKLVKGITYKSNDEIITNEGNKIIQNLDSLPFPARDFLVKSKLKCAQVKTSRGCFGKCSFCPSKNIAYKYRCRSVENILDELGMLNKKYNIKILQFTDKSFEDPEDDPTRLKNLLKGIIERGLEMFYFAYFRPTIHRRIDNELLTLLLKSGLYSVCLGIEAGNEKDLVLFNKNATLLDIKNSIELFQKNDIFVIPGFIFFNPYSTFDTLRENIHFLKEYKFCANFTLLTNRYNLVLGTPLYKKIKDDGLIKENEDNKFKYNFVIPEIGYLAEHINNYRIKVNESSKGLGILEFYTKYFTLILKLYKRMLVNEGLDDEYNFVCSIEKDMDGLIEKLNENNYLLFIKLLNLAESKWNTDTADLIIDEYINTNYINEYIKKFAKLKKQLHKDFISHGLESHIIL